MRGRFLKRARDWLKSVKYTPSPEGVALDGIVVLVFVAVIGIACFSPWPWEESPWVALAAIATFSAAGVALWLGWREGAWRRQEHAERVARADLLLAMQSTIPGQALHMIITVRDALTVGNPPNRYQDESLLLTKAIEVLREVDHAHLLEVNYSAGRCLVLCIANLNGVVPMLWIAAYDDDVRRQALACVINAHRDITEVIEFLYSWPDNPLQRESEQE